MNIKEAYRYVTVGGELAHVELTRGAVAVIDAADAAEVGKSLWCLDEGYATTNLTTDRGQEKLSLHRFLLSAPIDVEVDHVNGNTLDNRRSNLRLCTRSENARNSRGLLVVNGKPASSVYKGVSLCHGKYVARIVMDGKEKHLGRFTSPLAAALAYDRAARKHHREFARTNF